MRTLLLAISASKASSINYCKLVREDYAEETLRNHFRE